MKKLTTVKQVLSYIERAIGRDERDSDFICNSLIDITGDIISFKLRRKVRMYLNHNKPTSKRYPKYYNYKYFYKNEGSMAWWNLHSADIDGKFDEVMNEKRKFLRMLIRQINKEIKESMDAIDCID